MDVLLQPGDIVMTRGEGFLGRAIRFFTRHIGESRTKVNHVGIVVQGGTIEQAVIIEASLEVVRHRLIDEYGGKRDSVAIARATRLSKNDLQQVVAKATGYLGRTYGFGKIALHALDWALQGAFVFRRLGQMDAYPICSWLVAHAYSTAGVYFGVAPGAASPDDIWDHVTTRKGEFSMVRALSPLPAEQDVRKAA